MLVVFAALFSLLYAGFFWGGPSVTTVELGRAGHASGAIPEFFVVTPRRSTADSRRRMRSVREFLRGVRYRIVRGNATAGCASGHLTALEMFLAGDPRPGSFAVILEDSVCAYSPASGTGLAFAAEAQNILVKADLSALAVNFGKCVRQTLSETLAGSNMVQDHCILERGFGPCSYAWAVSGRHAAAVASHIRGQKCTEPVSMILEKLSDAEMMQSTRCFMHQRSPTLPQFSHTLVAQCP